MTGLAAVFDPWPRDVHGEAFLLLAGTLLLFRSSGEQELFKMNMKRTRYQPAGGYRTDFADAAQEVPDHE